MWKTGSRERLDSGSRADPIVTKEYVDDPDEAGALESGMTRPLQYHDDLCAIAADLHVETGVWTILTLSPSGGSEPALTFQ